MFHGEQGGAGTSDIFVVNADGSGQRALTESPANDVEAAWSPDGTQIAFSSDRDGNYNVYLMDADGGNQRRLTDDPATDWTPAWSRDGAVVLFSSNRSTDQNQDGKMQIFAADAKTGETKLLIAPKPGFSVWAPSWSPTRDEVVYVTDAHGQPELYLFDVGSGKSTRLTNNDRLDERPAWSPDGESLVYMGAKENTSIFDPDEIWVIARGGGAPRQLTDNLYGDIMPSWSPDGRWIAFSSTKGGDWSIYAMPATGGESRPVLTSGPARARAPRWGK